MKRWHWFDARIGMHKFDVACEFLYGDLIVNEIRWSRGEDDITDILSADAYEDICQQVVNAAVEDGMIKRFNPVREYAA